MILSIMYLCIYYTYLNRTKSICSLFAVKTATARRHGKTDGKLKFNHNNYISFTIIADYVETNHNIVRLDMYYYYCYANIYPRRNTRYAH